MLIEGGGITESFKQSRPFIEDIVDGMFDWVRVLDTHDNVIYMNKAMKDSLGSDLIGSKCYHIIGRSEPCANCISRQAVFDGACHEKEEYIHDRVFSVMSSPVRNEEGKVIAAVEVLRETTQLKQLYQEMQAQNDQFRLELEMARKLQASLLPGPITDPRIDFSFIYMPCESLGGDFLDIFKIDDSRIGLYIADVSGHGVPASLLTVFLRSTLDKKQPSPAKALEALYHEFNQSKLDEELYITIFYAIVDLDHKTMVYSNAGLNCIPLVYNSNRFDLLRLPGIPISNWTDRPEYVNGTATLQSGDKLFLYSDGILEMKNKDGEQYGEERLLEIMMNDRLKPKQLLLNIKKSAFQFAGIRSSRQLQDDVTMALLEIK
jgi:sigma-B regulation protein RsbU (phosphoserine phosphatase)